jgi:2,3-bisphosphoglycerate-dependent phosphoglycerate mutase
LDHDQTRLILIRHAHVDTGTDGRRMCGWLDVPLSSTGELQLQSMGNEPSQFKPLALYSSSSSRALSTAEALAANWNVEVTIDPDLREINSGAMEGMLIDEVKHRFLDLWIRNASQNDSDFAWPNGETYRNLRERVFAALSRISTLHPNARIPVVTHTGVIAQVVGALKGLSPAVWEQHRPAPLTATEIIWRGAAPVQLLSFNVADWWQGL